MLATICLTIPVSFFWTQDAIMTHVPESSSISNFILGTETQLSLFTIQGTTTHLVTGGLFALFGKNLFASSLAQLLFKCLAIFATYNIAKTLWNSKVGAIAASLYALSPNNFFYTTVFYKESAVQALYALALLSTLKILVEKKISYFSLLIISIGLLNFERFYIAYLVLPMILLLVVYFFKKPNWQQLGVFATLLGLISFMLFKFKYSELNLESILHAINNKRAQYSSYSDVLNKYNYDIPYVLAFVKILFSPYLTFNKFKIFSDFSLLLIWGSPINQCIILAALVGLYQTTKKNFMHLLIWMPFVIFLLLAAYISPWSGRLRDSFSPLICCYAAYFLINNKFFQRHLMPEKEGLV